LAGLQILEKLLASPFFGLFGLAVALVAIAATFAGRFSVGMARWIIAVAWAILMVWCYASASNFHHQTGWKVWSMVITTGVCAGLWKWVKTPAQAAPKEQAVMPAPFINFAPVMNQTQNATQDQRQEQKQKPEPPPTRPPEPQSQISFKNVRPAWLWYDNHENCFVEVQSSDYASVGG